MTRIQPKNIGTVYLYKEETAAPFVFTTSVFCLRKPEAVRKTILELSSCWQNGELFLHWVYTELVSSVTCGSKLSWKLGASQQTPSWAIFSCLSAGTIWCPVTVAFEWTVLYIVYSVLKSLFLNSRIRDFLTKHSIVQ